MRNLVATSATVLRHPEFLMLALAAAINFSSLACFIGSAPAIIEKHWGMSETSYAALFLPVITGIMSGAVVSRRIAGRMDLTRQVHMGLTITFFASLTRVILHLVFDPVPIPLQQALLFAAALGAQFAFPVLTLRMLDLFPAARGTASSAQSFVALLMTAFTLGIVSPKVLPHLEWIAWSVTDAHVDGIGVLVLRAALAAAAGDSRRLGLSALLDELRQRPAQLRHLRRLAQHAVDVRRAGRRVAMQPLAPAGEQDDRRTGGQPP